MNKEFEQALKEIGIDSLDLCCKECGHETIICPQCGWAICPSGCLGND